MNRQAFRPLRASTRAQPGAGRVPTNGEPLTTDSMNSTPETPAASLLFHAPVFKAAEPLPPSIPSQDLEEHEAPKRQRRTRKAKDETVKEEAESESSDTPKRKRRTRKVKEEVTPEEDGAQSSEDLAAQEGAEDSSQENEEEGTSSHRRRRRRTRPSALEESDPNDQVTALKGSTRLEAKKQRRKEGRREGRRRHGITESEFLARRESVKREMVIRDHEGLDQIAILEDGLLVEHYVARRTQKSMVGNIYLGRVQNVLPSMEAAFVDIGRGRNAVLYAGEVNWDAVGLEGKPRRIESALKSGDAVLVQVTKDPIGHKGARLTSQITLAGRYLVLIPNGSMMGISRKLPDRERTRLKKILKQVVPSGAGVIVRTAAEGASEEQIRDDVARLTKQWADIEAKQTHTKSAPVLLRGEPELAVRVVRDIFNEDFAKLLIQGRDTYSTVKDYVDELSPELSDRVEQWVGTDDVFHAHRIDEQLAKGMDRKVWLPSGGTLIIDRTEAMTVVDVNTGKFIGAGGTLEETVTKNNLEAAEEIVRQLRLRDIGGIIIVDFVDMVLESNRDLVLRRLVECLGRDRTRHQVTEITSLGLVQMTRKRVGEGLVEAFSTSCEACEGRGFIVHDHPVETTGAQDRTGSAPKKDKRKKSAPESRRVDDDVDHEKAKRALSAIAAASRKAEDSVEKTESAPDHNDADSSHLEGAQVQAEAFEEPPAHKRPARHRRSGAAQSVDIPASDEESKPKNDSGALAELASHVEPHEVDVAKAEVKTQEVAVEEETTGQEQVENDHPGERQPRPRRRRRALSLTEEPMIPALEPTPNRREAEPMPMEPQETGEAAQETRPPAQRRKATKPGEKSFASEVSSQTVPQEETVKRRRRRQVSSESVEPAALTPALSIELPKRQEGPSTPTALMSTDLIALPEAKDAPEMKKETTSKRRRRVASTGVIDAG